MKPNSAQANALINLLVSRHVALTSTLPVFEQSVPLHSPLQARQMDVLTPQAKESYLYLRNLTASRAGTPRGQQSAEAYQNDLGLERQFVAAGGLLMAGPGPTGNGGGITGFGDQREIELLVEAGFTPVEAIRIATLNGATFLGLADRIGSIPPGKVSALVGVDGNPAAQMRDGGNCMIVLNVCVGHDSAHMLHSGTG